MYIIGWILRGSGLVDAPDNLQVKMRGLLCSTSAKNRTGCCEKGFFTTI